MKNTNKGKSKTQLYGIAIFLLCTIIVMQVLAQEQNRPEMKPTITGWQHLAFTYTINETPKVELARNINKLGREGWEMVSVGNIIESGTTTQTIFYFKKPL
jgi:hypothetical protein